MLQAYVDVLMQSVVCGGRWKPVACIYTV